MGGWYGVVFCIVSCMRPTVYNAPTLFILYRVVEANSITLALGGEGGGGGGGGRGLRRHDQNPPHPFPPPLTATHLHLHLTFFDVPQRFGFKICFRRSC